MTLPDIDNDGIGVFKFLRFLLVGFEHTSPGNCLMCLLSAAIISQVLTKHPKPAVHNVSAIVGRITFIFMNYSLQMVHVIFMKH